MVSFKQLYYAVAVDKERHFKRAAEACAVSQSALSSAIAELEHQLDTKLFERDNKRVLTTPVGEQVIAKARDILSQVEDLRQIPMTDHAPLSYPITMGVIPTIGPYLLPKVLPEVRKQYPNSQLSIIEDQSHRLVDQVRLGELDTAIIALPYPLEGLEYIEFWSENFCVVTHQESELAKQKQVSAKELELEQLLLLSDGHCLKDHALAACRIKIQPSNDAMAHASLYTLIQMVAGKMGTTLVPEMAVKQLLGGSSELAAVALAEPGPHRSVAMIYRPGFTGRSNVELLAALFTATLES